MLIERGEYGDDKMGIQTDRGKGTCLNGYADRQRGNGDDVMDMQTDRGEQGDVKMRYADRGEQRDNEMVMWTNRGEREIKEWI